MNNGAARKPAAPSQAPAGSSHTHLKLLLVFVFLVADIVLLILLVRKPPPPPAPPPPPPPPDAPPPPPPDAPPPEKPAKSFPWWVFLLLLPVLLIVLVVVRRSARRKAPQTPPAAGEAPGAHRPTEVDGERFEVVDVESDGLCLLHAIHAQVRREKEIENLQNPRGQGEKFLKGKYSDLRTWWDTYTKKYTTKERPQEYFEILAKNERNIVSQWFDHLQAPENEKKEKTRPIEDEETRFPDAALLGLSLSDFLERPIEMYEYIEGKVRLFQKFGENYEAKPIRLLNFEQRHFKILWEKNSFPK